MHSKSLFFVLTVCLPVTACVSKDVGNLLVQDKVPESETVSSIETRQSDGVVRSDLLTDINTEAETEPIEISETSFATDQNFVQVKPQKPRNQKTFLINGLASNVGTIGYGFTNLSKKIPGSKLHNYATFVESSTLIRSEVTKELKAAHKQDPDVEINLIGISFGANIVTLIAADLDRVKIPVNYLVTLDGPAMVPIRSNVRIADNFTCTKLDCFKTSSKLSSKNKTTEFSTYKIKSSHIPLADHAEVHQRILAVLEENPQESLAQQ